MADTPIRKPPGTQLPPSTLSRLAWAVVALLVAQICHRRGHEYVVD